MLKYVKISHVDDHVYHIHDHDQSDLCGETYVGMFFTAYLWFLNSDYFHVDQHERSHLCREEYDGYVGQAKETIQTDHSIDGGWPCLISVQV